MKKLLLILLSLCLLLTFVACGETVSVTGAAVDENGDLIVTFSDGTTQNAGKVKGEDGKDGAAADAENPLGLDFYPLPDGTWVVSKGKTIYLEEIAIPQTYKGKIVACIGDSAFYDHSNLSSITIPNGVTSIGDYAFMECSSLQSITIPSSVTSIGERAFFLCSSLSSITIPSSVTSIGDSAFCGCSSLQSVTILNGVTSIDSFAFFSCNNLQSVVISSSVTNIGVQAFSDCPQLSNIYFTGTETQWNAIEGSSQIDTSIVTFNYTA